MKKINISKSFSQSLSRKILFPFFVFAIIVIGFIFVLIPYLFQAAIYAHIKNEVTQAAEVVGKADAQFNAETAQWIVEMIADQGQFDLIVVTEGQDLRVSASTRPEWIGLRMEEIPDTDVMKNFNDKDHIDSYNSNTVFIKNTIPSF